MDAVADPGSPASFQYSDQARERFRALDEYIARLRSHLRQPLPDLVAQVISESGLDVEVALRQRLADLRSGTNPGDVGSAALSAFESLVECFAVNADRPSLGAFLSWIASLERLDAMPDFELPMVPDSVQLVSIHKAKGLEWDVVFTPFVTEGVFPANRARSRWTSSMSTLPHGLRGDRDALPDLRAFGTQGHDEFGSQLQTFQAHEERRLGRRRNHARIATVGRVRPLVGANSKEDSRTVGILAGPSAQGAAFDASEPWTSELAHDSNPQLNDPECYQWPLRSDPQGQRDRQVAAALVRGAAAELKRGG